MSFSQRLRRGYKAEGSLDMRSRDVIFYLTATMFSATDGLCDQMLYQSTISKTETNLEPDRSLIQRRILFFL